MRTRTLRAWILGTIVLAIAACGGGGGGTAPATGATGGTGAGPSGVAFGTITQFGSVWVNGVEYASGSATIRIDDNPATERDLKLGMVVRVDGSIADKSAATITVDDAIKGYVEQVLDANRMIVMGQTVQIDGQTLFDNGVVPAVDDRVDVHGLIAGDGVLTASLIEKKVTPPSPPFAVKGLVKGHDGAAQTFRVGALVVSYRGAAIGDMRAGSWNGVQVDAKGTACAGSPVCGTLTASKVEPAGAKVADAAEAEFEGVASALSASGFALGNQSVVVSSTTRYEGGTLADIAPGSKLEVEGAISGGVLAAVKVSFRDSVRIEADVASVDAVAQTVTLAGLPGITVSTSSITEFKGSARSLADLAANNHLRIRGRAGSGGSVVASELERKSASPDSRVVLQAAVAAFAAPNSLTLLGVVVDTGAVADSDFHDSADLAVGRTAFFNATQVGILAKARGTRSNGSVSWDQMELEQ